MASFGGKVGCCGGAESWRADAGGGGGGDAAVVRPLPVGGVEGVCRRIGFRRHAAGFPRHAGDAPWPDADQAISAKSA
jgi:hypothetical protein